MLNWLIRRRIDAFERTFHYDMSYARELLAADRRAFMAWARVMAVSRHRRDVPLDVYYAVKLVGTVAEDCGFLRWQTTRRAEVEEPRAYLARAVARLALDRLKSARLRREHDVGTWLPEPVVEDAAAGARGATRAHQRPRRLRAPLRRQRRDARGRDAR